MSDRIQLFGLTPVNATNPGHGCDALELFRDNDTKTYRIFVISEIQNVDLTIEELSSFSEALTRAVEQHQPWPKYSDDFD